MIGMPDAWPERLRRYYDSKGPEYQAKYGIDGRVHIHTAHFSASRQPEVFRDGWIRPSLGKNYLRSLIQRGQERTISLLLRRFPSWASPQHVLDCGAGLGGTAFLLAERFNAEVHALTISPSQGEVIASTAKDLGLGDYVTPLVTDVFDPSWTSSSGPYDCILGIDAFCQMGDYKRLLKILSGVQDRRGLLAVSNYYSTPEGVSLARYFNEYWVSRIEPLDHMIAALQAADYDVIELEDTSRMQLPYWEMSIALNSLDIRGWSSVRRQESSRFHAAMREGFQRGEMRYVQLVAVKR